MRLHIKTTPNTVEVPFEYQQKLVGVLHKWLGDNNSEHDVTSLYSFSWLQNGNKLKDSLMFAQGAQWFISFHDEKVAKLVLKAILKQPEMFLGMNVCDVIVEENPDFSNKSKFLLASPIFIKRTINQVSKQYSYEEDGVGELMKQTLFTKMKIAGLKIDETLDIQFDLTYPGKKRKMIYYNKIGNKANMCPVIIHGMPETKIFAWNVGIGNSTGIGFGSIY
ncbi:MAG: CRISPR-associated endoribonuclease Cas6 [Anaerovoracaceae bacterium]